jgi:hypothetical protein
LRDSQPIRIPSNLLGLLSEIQHYPPPDDAAETGVAADRVGDRDVRGQRKRR